MPTQADPSSHILFDNFGYKPQQSTALQSVCGDQSCGVSALMIDNSHTAIMLLTFD
jgi:hypothetical protein